MNVGEKRYSEDWFLPMNGPLYSTKKRRNRTLSPTRTLLATLALLVLLAALFLQVLGLDHHQRKGHLGIRTVRYGGEADHIACRGVN